jgi:hypothetical protein
MDSKWELISPRKLIPNREISEEHALLVCGRHFQMFLHVLRPPPHAQLPTLIAQ